MNFTLFSLLYSPSPAISSLSFYNCVHSDSIIVAVVLYRLISTMAFDNSKTKLYFWSFDPSTKRDKNISYIRMGNEFLNFKLNIYKLNKKNSNDSSAPNRLPLLCAVLNNSSQENLWNPCGAKSKSALRKATSYN